MESLRQYLVPYLVSNVLFVLTVLAAIKRPMWARIFLAVLFIWAAYINSETAAKTPEIYLDYARFTPLALYKRFILGYFSKHIVAFVYLIAGSQLLIFIGLLLKDGWVRCACAGGIIFGLVIAPFGVGSAFPATLLMSLAFLILFRRNNHGFIWNWNQYKVPVSGLQ